MTNKHGLRKDANYTEDLVGFAIESFLATMNFPRLRFSIEPFSRARERWLGADARLSGKIRGFCPFYMQFKRPSAYPDVSKAGIVTDRRSLKLAVSPHTLYFDLRQKQPQHWDFQHNILLRLRRRLRSRGIGDAAYVCPLFLDRSAYRFHLHWSGLSLWPRFWRRRPWDMEDVLLNDNGNMIRFDRVPILREHITVPPHDPVTNSKHRYSFTEAGTDLCFHSPQALPDGATNLATFLTSVAAGFLDGEAKIRTKEANDELQQLISAIRSDQPDGTSIEFAGDDEDATSDDEEPTIDDEDPIGNWLSWGHYLSVNYGIEQYAMVSWEE
jgi:hypothetical protein